jgi:hypothetical protein
VKLLGFLLLYPVLLGCSRREIRSVGTADGFLTTALERILLCLTLTGTGGRGDWGKDTIELFMPSITSTGQRKYTISYS